MSNQSFSNSSNNSNYWLSSTGVKQVYFQKLSAPPFAIFDRGILYELDDGILYYNGNAINTGSIISGSIEFTQLTENPGDNNSLWMKTDGHIYHGDRDIENNDPTEIYVTSNGMTIAEGANGFINSPLINLVEALSLYSSDKSGMTLHLSTSFPSSISIPPNLFLQGNCITPKALIGPFNLTSDYWNTESSYFFNQSHFYNITSIGLGDIQFDGTSNPLLLFDNCSIQGGILCDKGTLVDGSSNLFFKDSELISNIQIIDTDLVIFNNCNFSVLSSDGDVQISHLDDSDMMVIVSNCSGGGIFTINHSSIANILTVKFIGDVQFSSINVNTVGFTGGVVLYLDDTPNINFSGGTEADTTVNYIKRANQVSYIPQTSGNWSPVPTLVSEALDQLASVATGNVIGPVSSTDNAITRFDGSTGKLIQNSSVIISDSGNISTPGTISANTIAPNTGPALQLSATGSVLLVPGASGAVEVTNGLGVYTTNVKGPAGALTALVNGINPLSCVVGPASSTDNALVRFDTTTGKLAQNSTWLLDDNGVMSFTGANIISFNSTTQNSYLGRSSGGTAASPGSGLTCVGHQSGFSIQDTGGALSTFIGAYAGRGVTTGLYNTMLGANAGYNQTTGFNNTLVGRNAGVDMVTGDSNVGLGTLALSGKNGGSNNIAIGYQSAQSSPAAINGGIYLGSYGNAADVDNTMRLGRFSGTTTAVTFIAGVRGVTTAGVAIPVLVDINGQFGTASSSIQYKENVVTISDEECSKIHDMRFVDFNYIGSSYPQRGVIAEEISPIDDNICIYDDNERTQMRTVDYQQIMVLIGAEVQRMKRQIDTLTLRVAALEGS